MNYPHKLGLLAQFLSGRMSNPERGNLLRKEGIRYVLLGPEEKALAGGTASFEDLPMKEVHRIGEIIIFQVEE
ncbi:MAG: hypothetical protein GTO55_05885 [Armatimonadetes bacterium]|nr:hypothetical protein [Armatimonadota bacterium]NIM23784.1 hypothetical protein [Armatimonadota bacterium]NIM67661.1 hypothetical protein [Armatimonadota bacterium]NIM76177.1 hypothetical protein [Armatimonadota bacterium]NIN05862.1 hypothetical protein [Armatimonadota bacterium]